MYEIHNQCEHTFSVVDISSLWTFFLGFYLISLMECWMMFYRVFETKLCDLQNKTEVYFCFDLFEVDNTLLSVSIRL